MKSFQSLGIRAPILSALADCGYQEPTLIQEKAIPAGLAGRDVLGSAQTGTGKTCAFGVPILQRLAKAGKGTDIRALILTPTRELAIQIDENLKAYGKNLPLTEAVIFGGVGQAPQVEQLKKGVDILTATPGRLLDLAGQGLLDLSHVSIFVLDEADRMLDMGFIHDVRRVIKLLPEKKQTMFFSATLPPEILDLVDTLLHDPVKVAAAPVSSPVEVIRQAVCLVDRGNKTNLLAFLLEEEQVKNALVFTRTKHGADKVARDLAKRGVAAAAIHTPRHTSTLHNTPGKRACSTGRSFPMAVAARKSSLPANTPLHTAMAATAAAPMKLPRYTTPQLRSIRDRVMRRSSQAMDIMQLPVKSSVPVSTTMASPAGNTHPAMRRRRERFATSMELQVEATPARAMKAPARMAETSIFPKGSAAFRWPTVKKLSHTSAGERERGFMKRFLLLFRLGRRLPQEISAISRYL